MEINIDNLIAIGGALLGGGGFLYYKQNNRNKKIENDNLVITQMTELVTELKVERQEMKQERDENKAFYESELQRVVASNQAKAEKIERLENEKREYFDENMRLKLVIAEKDKQIAVQRERECLRSECNKRMSEGEDSPATFPVQ